MERLTLRGVDDRRQVTRRYVAVADAGSTTRTTNSKQGDCRAETPENEVYINGEYDL